MQDCYSISLVKAKEWFTLTFPELHRNIAFWFSLPDQIQTMAYLLPVTTPTANTHHQFQTNPL